MTMWPNLCYAHVGKIETNASPVLSLYLGSSVLATYISVRYHYGFIHIYYHNDITTTTKRQEYQSIAVYRDIGGE